MFDWMFEKRIRVRVGFITCWCDYHINECDTRLKILGALALYEGTAKDKKLYLRERRVTNEFYGKCNFTCGGHKEPGKEVKFEEIEKDAWIEFNCWESTFKKLNKDGHNLYCFDIKNVGEEVL